MSQELDLIARGLIQQLGLTRPEKLDDWKDGAWSPETAELNSAQISQALNGLPPEWLGRLANAAGEIILPKYGTGSSYLAEMAQRVVIKRMRELLAEQAAEPA